MNQTIERYARRVATATAGNYGGLADLFKVLADPTRLRILGALAENGSLCVHELTTWLGMRQPTVSHSLRMLRAARLVKGRRTGREIHYRIHDSHVLTVLSQALKHV